MTRFKVEMEIEVDNDQYRSSLKRMLGRILQKEGQDTTYPGLRVTGDLGDIVLEKIHEPVTSYEVFGNARLTCPLYGEHIVAWVADDTWSLVGLKDGDSYDGELHASIDKLLESLVCPEEWTLTSQGDGGDSGTWEGGVAL